MSPVGTSYNVAGNPWIRAGARQSLHVDAGVRI
jgi:hypothetical protein